MAVFDVACAADSEIPDILEVPTAGAVFDTVAKDPSTPSAFVSPRTGRLKLVERADSTKYHYCTAEIIKSGGAANAILLLTAAHCLRPDLSFVSFTSESGSHIADIATAADAVECTLRNKDWRDPPFDSPPNKFINARLDYGFIRLKPSIVTGWPFFKVDWSGTWKDSNPLRFKQRINVVGYPDSSGNGTVALKLLSSSDLTIVPDFYHQKLNRISTADTTFTKGTSGGAWLDMTNAYDIHIVSITSAYVGTRVDADTSEYITLYGPILHDDARKYAELAGNSSTTDGSECQ
jgi:hypothetical protein